MARARFANVPMVCISIMILSSVIGRPKDVSTKSRKLNLYLKKKKRERKRKRKPIHLAASAHVHFRILRIERYICLTKTALSFANAATVLRSFSTVQTDCIGTRGSAPAIGQGSPSVDDSRQTNDAVQNRMRIEVERSKSRVPTFHASIDYS